MRYPSTTSTLGSWEVSYLRTFIKAAAAAGTASSGGQGGKSSFHSGQSRPVQGMFLICLGNLAWVLTNTFHSRIFYGVSLRLQYIAAITKVSPDFLRPLTQAFFLESIRCLGQLASGYGESKETYYRFVLHWRKI